MYNKFSSLNLWRFPSYGKFYLIKQMIQAAKIIGTGL